MEKEIVKDSEELIKDSIQNTISYTAYRDLVAGLAKEGKSTGENQTEALTNYTMLNDRRMKRLDKTLKFDVDTLPKVVNETTWIVLTESWCGDAAQTMPVMHKIAEADPKLNFKVLLRDENLELMNQFLTNGGMSIPKLIAVDNASGKVIGNWGPRPSVATKMAADYKQEHGKLTPEFKQDLQLWYTKDKGQNTVEDLKALLTLK